MTTAGTRIVRIGLWAIVGVLALLGLVTAHTALLVFTVLAFCAGGIAGGMGGAGAIARSPGRATGPGPIAWARVGKYAAGAAVGVLTVAGLVAAGGVLVLVVLPALVVLALCLHQWRATPSVVPDPVPTGTALTELTNAELAHRWRGSYGDLAATRDAAALERLCQDRMRLLDEIERRDPVGFRRWLQGGNWVRGDSAPFLG